MNKRYKILLLLLAMTANQLSAQDEFAITEDTNTHNTSFVSQCQSPELGVIVFTTSINGLTFNIQNESSLLISYVHDIESNQYILCVQPIKRGKQYQILITSQGFKNKVYIVSAIGAAEVKWFRIDSKNESLTLRLDKTNQEVKTLEKENEYEKFQNKKLIKKYNYISAGYSTGIAETSIGEWNLGWCSEGKVGWGIHAGFRPISPEKSYETKFIYYSVGVRCYPFRSITFFQEAMKPITMEDTYIMVGYGTVSKYPELARGAYLLTGIDWVIPFFKNPDGGVIFRVGTGIAYTNLKTTPWIFEGGIALYFNLNK